MLAATLTDAGEVRAEGRADHLVPRCRAGELGQRARVTVCTKRLSRRLELAASEPCSRRRPGEPVALPVLCAQLRAERDQLGQIRHGQHLLECRDANESLCIEVVPEQKRRVDVFGREEPRLSVVEEIPLVDRLEPEREALLGQR